MLFVTPLRPQPISRVPSAIKVAVNVPEVDPELRLVVFCIIGHFSHKRLQMLFCIVELMHEQRPFGVIILFGDHGRRDVRPNEKELSHRSVNAAAQQLEVH
jgi:hypothetical protein